MAGEKDTDSRLTLNRIASLGNISRIHLRARTSDLTPMDEVQFFFAVELEDGTQYVAQDIQFRKHERYTPMGTFVEIPTHALQAVVDDLWDLRVRAHASLASSGQLETINNHLTDLRRLVFDYEVKSKPPAKGGTG